MCTPCDSTLIPTDGMLYSSRKRNVHCLFRLRHVNHVVFIHLTPFMWKSCIIQLITFYFHEFENCHKITYSCVRFLSLTCPERCACIELFIQSRHIYHSALQVTKLVKNKHVLQTTISWLMPDANHANYYKPMCLLLSSSTNIYHTIYHVLYFVLPFFINLVIT